MNQPVVSPPPFTSLEQGESIGYEAHYEYSERMQVTQYHCHDYYELYIHLQGGEYMGVDNKMYVLKPNQVFILPPFYMHGLICMNEMHGYERAYLNLSPEVLSTLGCGQIDLNEFFRSHADRGHYTYQLSDASAERFVYRIRQLQESSGAASSSVDRFNNYSLIMSILNLLCQVIARSEPEADGISSNSMIQEILTYINTHYTEEIRIDDLARRFNVSNSYLSHEFSRFTNRSIYEYILYRRVMLSRQLMMGQQSLNAIAFRCGFNDYSNFLRSFSRIVGVPPSQYRKRIRQYRNLALD